MSLRARTAAATVLLAAGTLVQAAVDLARVDPRTAADCDALVANHPRDMEAYRCFFLVARRHQQWTESMERLEARLRLDPDDHRARFYLGRIEGDRLRPRAEALFREAAEGFAAGADVTGEVYSRLSLAHNLRFLGRTDEADAELQIGARLAEEAQDPDLIFLARLQQARSAQARGDTALARTLLGDLARSPVPEQQPWLPAEVLTELGGLAWRDGAMKEAQGYYEAAATAYRRIGDPYMEASQRYNVALIAGRSAAPGFRDLIRQAIEAARRGRNPGAEVLSRLLRAQDDALDVDVRIAEIETVLRLARTLQDPGTTAFALRLLASQLLTEGDPAQRPRALRLLDEAIAVSQSSGNVPDVTRAYIVRAYDHGAAQTGDEVAADYLAAIDNIEKLRDLQRDEISRARMMWQWAFVYYRFAGYLLGSGEDQPSREHVDLAFAAIERLRARLLLDAMDVAHATDAAAPEGAASRAREDVLRRIAEVQRRLLSPGLSEQERAMALSELDALEAREVDLRATIAEASPSFALLRRPEIPSLTQVQETLEEDQALVAFHLSTRKPSVTHPRVEGGSWAFVVTRASVRVVPLPEEDVLAEQIAVYRGLITRRDALLEGEAAARLHADLLDEVLDGLPDEVTRLVIVPHGALYRVPFGALRATPAAAPLAARFQISLVPSATLWYHRRQGTRPETSAVLAFADPDIPAVPGDAAAERAAQFTAEHRLGPLPYAREEARSLVHDLGRGSLLRIGRDASERFVKTADLRRFGVLHFAAHAVVDEHEPQRSAVVLAPGADDEDGLLQIREIVGLRLRHPLVILSACSSASGEVTEGEGVVGLARAFLQAGAAVVVASLWPLQDDEAAGLVEDLGRHLGEGASVGAALAAVRRSRIEAGAPTAAWAGLVALGDADLIPAPGGARRALPGWAWPVAVAALLLAPASILLRRNASRRR